MTWIPEINAVWAKHVYNDLRSRGLDAEAAIKSCSIRRTAISKKEGLIPFERHCALLAYAAEITDDDLYGLNLGMKIVPRDAGLIGYIGLSSATIQDAIENFIRYATIMGNVPSFHMSVEGDIAILEGGAFSHPFPRGYEQDAEFSVAIFINGCRIFCGQDISPLKVSFLHRRTKHIAEFERVLGCPVSFGDRDLLTLRREHLLLPIASNDDELLSVLKGYGDRILKERSLLGPDFKHQVEKWIVQLLPKGQATSAVIAMELGMSERTLSRRLAELDLNFKTLLEDVRRDLSLKYVAEPGISVKQTSFLLGYSDASAFSHAFKRWTGDTPASYRRAAVGG